MEVDLRSADPLYQPAPYWRPHVDDLFTYLAEHGFRSFRRGERKAIRAFAGSVPALNRSYRPRLWKLHDTAKRVPFLRSIAESYEAELDVAYGHALAQRDMRLRLAMQLVRERDPTLAALEDLRVGDPPTITIGRRNLSENFVDAVLECSELGRLLDMGAIRTILEIGAGYGALAEVIARRYPHTRFVLVDLPPVCAFAEYYLAEVSPGDVLGYAETRQLSRLDPDEHDERFLVVASYHAPRLAGQFDLMINIGSFQEMSTTIVQNYADIVSCLRTRWIYMKNAAEEHANRPGLTADFYEDIFPDYRAVNRSADAIKPGQVRHLLELAAANL